MFAAQFLRKLSTLPSLFGRRKIPDDRNGSSGSILVVDDQGSNRALLVRLLNMLGHAADSTADGADALTKWRNGRYDLLITDCNMPGLDGYALVRRIREEEHAVGRLRIPIIAWTASPSAEEIEKISAAGMDGHLNKPIDPGTLEQLLNRTLGVVEMPTARSVPAPALQVFAAAMLDDTVLARYSGGDPEVEREILDEFATSSRNDAESLRHALAQEDSAGVAQYSHRLKGASRMIGAFSLAAACMRLELDGRTGDWNRIRADQHELFQELHKLHAVLSARQPP